MKAECSCCGKLLDTGFNCHGCGAKFRYDFETKTLIPMPCGQGENNKTKRDE